MYPPVRQLKSLRSPSTPFPRHTLALLTAVTRLLRP
jgi:hypothetical protein